MFLKLNVPIIGIIENMSYLGIQSHPRAVEELNFDLSPVPPLAA